MNFRRKCVDKIWDFKKRGKALFFCSHSLYDVRQLCDQAASCPLNGLGSVAVRGAWSGS